MQCVILAGGLGTRMRPFTEDIPKALIPVNGAPFLHHQIELLRGQGIHNIVLSIGYKGELIRSFAGDGSRWGVRISYSDEGTNLLGTAGALRLALDEGLLSDRFFVLYGDSYLPIPFAPVWNAACPSALMTVFHNAGRWEKSNVIYRDGIVELYDKNSSHREAMHHVDYGLSVFRRDVIREMTTPGVKSDLSTVLHRLSIENRLAGFEVKERFYEIGSPEGLHDLSTYLSMKSRTEHMTDSGFAERFLRESVDIIQTLDSGVIESLATGLADVRNRGGRLFILGVGGSAGHASHAVNDFRKLCGFEAYSPTDNASELTARVNDEGWDTTFTEWLRGSRLASNDAVLVFSVGGGDREANVSMNIVRALELAQQVNARVFGIVGRNGGFTAQVADACVVVPPLFAERVTPHTEGLCAVIWHLLVSHPALQMNPTKWESLPVEVTA